MSATIREYVNRRLRWFHVCSAIGLGLFFVPRVLDDHEVSSRLVKIVALLVLAGGAIVMARVRCPRCSKPLGKSFMWQRGTLDLCHNCGVRLDEPLP
jgi:hypothetical protein